MSFPSDENQRQLFATAHQRLAAATAYRDWRDDVEDPNRPETIQAMQMALHLPKQNPPARSEVLAAAAQAVLEVCLDPLAGGETAHAEALAQWYGRRIRKLARRARNKAWEDIQMIPGATVNNMVRAFVPSAMDQVDPLIAKLQIGHTDMELDEPAPPCPEDPVIYVDAGLNMSAGKAAAQVGHASMLLAGDMSLAEVQAWAQRDFALAVREVPSEQFSELCQGAVVVRDAGFTEVAPDSATVCARRANV